MNKIKNTDDKNIKTYLDWLNKDQAFLAEFDITHIKKETDSHELNENVLNIKKDSNTKNWTNFKYAKSKKLLKLKNSNFNFYGHLNQALNNDIIVLMNCIEAYDKANSTNFLYFKNKFKEVHDYNLNFAKDFIVNPQIGSSLFIKDNDNILTPLGSRVDIDLYLDSNFKKKLSPDDKERSFIKFENKFYKLNKIEYGFITSIDTFNYDNFVTFFENQSEENRIK